MATLDDLDRQEQAADLARALHDREAAALARAGLPQVPADDDGPCDWCSEPGALTEHETDWLCSRCLRAVARERDRGRHDG
jgi:hypothetical protein